MAAASFDPCRQWLGIDAVDLSNPRLVLGLPAHEADRGAVLRAAEARIVLLRGIAAGPFEMARTALITRVEEARDALLAEIASAPIGTSFQPPPPPGGSFARPAVPLVARPAPGFDPAIPPAVPALPYGEESAAADAAAEAITIKTAPAYRKGSSWSGSLLLLLVGLAAAGGAMIWIKTNDLPVSVKAPPGLSKVLPNRKDRERPAAVAKPSPREEEPPESIEESRPPIRQRPVAMPEPQETAQDEPEPAELSEPSDTTSDAAVSTSPPPPPSPPEEQVAAKPEPRDASVAVEPPPGEAEKPEDTAPQVDGFIRDAFDALTRGEYEAATAALDAAEEMAQSDDSSRRIAGWHDLVTYAKGFAGYREKALADVRPGNEYVIDGLQIGVIEIDEQKFIYRDRGRNIVKPRDKIPTKILMTIVKQWFDAKPANHLFLGAYYATKPEPDADKAREHWERAQAGGADASTLLPLLDDPVLRAAANE